jgi:RNA polymerase sigma factor (sigma-70 family)
MPSPALITSDMAQPQDELLRTRATLLGRLKNWDDQPSWRQFFDTYWGLIYGVARQAGLSDAEAQDVVQEVMAEVAGQMPSFQYDPARGRFKNWLLTRTRWRIIDQQRKRRPGLNPETSTRTGGATTVGLDQLIDPAIIPIDALWEAEWENNLLNAALARVKQKIDPEKFQIFDFYVKKEWPAEKVAATFGSSVDQVYLIKHRVTEMLKEEVKRLEKELM